MAKTEMGRKIDRFFELAEANALIPQLVDLTADAVYRLEEMRRSHGIEENQEATLSEEILSGIQEVLAGWAREVLELGGQPKGFFTVDFPSPDPELLYCWTYGEAQITHTHKVWENFSHRRPLAGSAGGADHTKWIH